VWLSNERWQECAKHIALHFGVFEHLSIVQNYGTISRQHELTLTANYHSMSSQTRHDLQRSAKSYFHPLLKNNNLLKLKAISTHKQHEATRLLLQNMLTCRPTLTKWQSHAPLLGVEQQWTSQRQSNAGSTDQSSAGFWRCPRWQCPHCTVAVGCQQTETCRAWHEHWWHRPGSWSMPEHVQLTCWSRTSAANPAVDTETESWVHRAVKIQDQ